jgi:imidazolonepropionase
MHGSNDDTLLLRNISRLVTMEADSAREGALGVIAHAALLIDNGAIGWFGREAELPPDAKAHSRVDAHGAVVLPGLVDCHTHIVHAGFRQHEFNLRTEGKTYQEIAREGGGIMSTVRATREAGEEDLLAGAMARMNRSLAHGVSAIEIKTGYGLDYDAEMKLARVIEALRRAAPIRAFGTFLGAHVVPAEYRERRGDYLDLVVDRMLHDIASNDAIVACDVFVEEGAYTADEARRIARAAQAAGLSLHLHVDQFSDGGGGELAAELHALSADHLDRVSDAGIDAMARAGVVGVVLPGASFFTGRGHYPDVRRMIDRGLTVAIATDYNPGTSPCLDPWLMATIAVTQMGMSCDQALLGLTKHAAAALGLSDCGRIAPGLRADLVVLDAPDEYVPIYRYGQSFVREVRVAGQVRWRRA